MHSPPLPLRRARAHEATGPGAPVFAAVIGAIADGDVLWIHSVHERHRLMPQALATFLPPKRLLCAMGRNETDLLWMAEEALRSGALRLVVVELTRPLGLTPGRRLQLASEAGGSTGLCLIPEGGGSNAAETRWHCAHVLGEPDSTLMRWFLTKNKSGTFGEWTLRWDLEARCLRVVAAAGE